MPDPQHHSQPARPSSGAAPIPWKSLAFPLAILAVISTAAGFQFAYFADLATNRNSSAIAPSASLASAKNTPIARKTDLEDIANLPPQQQAERLLESAIQRRDSSIDLIQHDADSWRGRIQNTSPLFDLVLKALTSDDYRVRTAAIEVDLAANNLNKSPQSVDRLIQI